MKTGRKLKDINGEDVRRLAALGCTLKEVGAWFGCDEATIRHRFSAEYHDGKENGKTSLRRMQWKRARSGSDPMLIHLGKHILGQKDGGEQTNQVLPTVIELPRLDDDDTAAVAENKSTAWPATEIPVEPS